VPLEQTYSQNQLRDYSSLFTRSEAKAWMKKDFDSINYKINRYDSKWKNSQNTTYFDYLKYAYSIIEKYYQNEYVFKNSLLNEWLINEIGQSNAKIYSEYRVGNAIADLVMFNGNSKVFEIKTKFDTDHRLPIQLENYRNAFNQIFLVVPESKVHLYSKYDINIGLITFGENHNQKLKMQRKARTNTVIDANTIMNILHTQEYKSIVKSYFGVLPKMTSFNQYNKCYELLSKIPEHELNKLFISQMKNRGEKNALSKRYFKEFNQLSLALKLTKAERTNMIENLKSPLNV